MHSAVAVRSLSAFILCFIFPLLFQSHSRQKKKTLEMEKKDRCNRSVIDWDKFSYQDDDRVTLWVNNAGPYTNPQEIYHYYSLPFCWPSSNATQKSGSLGEVLGGNKLIDSQIHINFKRDAYRILICKLKLDSAMVKQFKNAIDNSYWFELFMDDLPLWGFVGEAHYSYGSHLKHTIYTHNNFEIKYNGDQIILVNFTQENPKPVEEGKVLNLTYSVKWTPTRTNFAHRFDIYLDHLFFEHQMHWFSVFNSVLMVIFLTGLVSKILMRTLSTEDTKYAREDDLLEALERDVSEESGWKILHGDVFRPPQNIILLSAIVGTGVQLAMLLFLVILLAIIKMLYIRRGAIITTSVYGYVITSIISGYVSGGMYSRYGGENWIKAMTVTSLFFPITCFGIWSILNNIAIFHSSSAAVSFGVILLVFAIWAFISLPLAAIGTVIGRNWDGAPNDPCRTNTIPRPIPDKKWYLTPSVISLIGGLFPFGSIFVELYYVFTSFWNYKIYYLYGVSLLAFAILIIVTMCVAIVVTYFLLNAENHHWQWTSFFSAASMAVYVFLYSIYYYHVKTWMSGVLQTSFYFGYTLIFCFGLGVLCGAVGYMGSYFFVRKIYGNIKRD